MLKNESSIREKYKNITKQLIKNKMTITTMESVTAGLIASLLTDTEGSSAVLKGAFITYSNEAKIMQGVPSYIIENYGVYSEETALQMANAAKNAYSADVAIGVTGTLGNVDPANQDSIIGEIHFSIVTGEMEKVCTFHLNSDGNRVDDKMQVADKIGDCLLEVLSEI